MFKFSLSQKYFKLDMENKKDLELYNKILQCVDIRITKEESTYIPPEPAVYDKMGVPVSDTIPAQFIKEITCQVIGENVPNEFK
jgi:hypothetical protein